MRDDTPTVYLLAGPSGPGKAAYIRALEEHGVVRLRADTRMSEETAAELTGHLAAGRDALVEYASADQAERERCQHLADRQNAQSLVVTFGVDHDHLVPHLSH